MNSLYLILGAAKKIALLSGTIAAFSLYAVVTDMVKSSFFDAFLGFTIIVCCFSIGVLLSKFSLLRDQEIEEEGKRIDEYLISEPEDIKSILKRNQKKILGGKSGKFYSFKRNYSSKKEKKDVSGYIMS